MHWEVLIIPLIAVAVWLLGTIFRGAEEERQRNRARRPGEGARPPRRPVTDLDRFLEEARRRREAVESAPKKPNPFEEARPSLPFGSPPSGGSSPVRVAPPVQRAREQQPARPPEPRPREAGTYSAPPPVRRPATPPAPPPLRGPVPLPSPAGARTVPEPEPPVPVRVVSEALVEARIDLASQGLPPAPPPPGLLPTRGPSPVLAQVAALLRTPQSAGVAFVLREILDKPLCQRGRR
jgi:hypothetical protein